jgi:hypothetical protein
MNKAITSDALATGGKLSPATIGSSALNVHDGLILSPSFMARAVIDGRKTLIVKTKPFEISNKDFILVSQRQALGVVHLGPMKEMGNEEFAATEPQHLITSELRAQWAEAQPSWKQGTLYCWNVKVLDKFDSPLRTNVGSGPQVTVRDVQVEGLSKIHDVNSYNPAEMTDAQLRDDMRILLAWYSTWRKNPSGFRYDLATIKRLLVVVLKELVKRGPGVVSFDPKGMKTSVRRFFMETANEANVPATMYKSQFVFDVDSDPTAQSLDWLCQAHDELHRMYLEERDGWSVEDVVNMHARVVDELRARGEKHPPPPDTGLDEMSADFEAKATEKGEYMDIRHSGNKLGPLIKINDVVDNFKTFKVRTPYVMLVGGLANHGETEGDIDILVNDEETNVPDWLKEVLAFRLGRALSGDVAKRLSIHYDRKRGPFTNHMELFDLVLERSTNNEVKEMRLAIEKSAEDEPLDEREEGYFLAMQKSFEDD